MSTVEFNHYEAMSYSYENTNSPLQNQIFQCRTNVNAASMQQQHQLPQQQRLAFDTEQTTLQQIKKTMPIKPPPLALQQTQQQMQENLEMSHEMQTATTTHTIAQNPTPQCSPHHSSTTQRATATASATFFPSVELAVENVMPGIYLTKNFIAWNEENLRTHGFTHIIIIDKHIQELYYPSPVFKFSTENTTVDAFDTYEYISHPACATSLKFGKEFEAIDLNFGENSYLTTVLPNCYRAVKFMNKALQSGGTILVIDCNGGEQKCITIIIAYLMYKYNIKFSNAFARLKDYYKKADLDRFYMTQLYEYEPILQVQRSQSRGQSCSREMNSAILKRKKGVNDEGGDSSSNSVSSGSIPFGNISTNDFLNNFNPLSNFNTTTTATNLRYGNSNLQQQQLKCQQLNAASSSLQQQTSIYCQYQDSKQTAVFNSAANGAIDCHAWDDSAMD